MAISLTNPQLKKLTETPENKTYTVAVTTVVVVVLLIFFAIRPSIASVFDKLNENSDKRKFIDQMEQKQQNLVLLTNKEVEQADQLALLDGAFPGSRKENEVLDILVSLSKSNSINLVSADLAISNEKSSIRTDLDINTAHGVVTIGVNGTRNQIWNFIGDLESSNRIINIQQIGMSSRIDENGNVGKLSDAEIVFEIYYYQKADV